jgi:transposase, IS30 family
VSFSAELKEKFFQVFDRVGSVTVAARVVGVNPGTAFGWAYRAGRRSVAPSRPHPRRGEYDLLRGQGVARRQAAEQVGINVSTAKDWDRGVRKTCGVRIYPDGRPVGYNSGVSTKVIGPPSLTVLERELHPRFLSLSERETIADMCRVGLSLRAIGRVLGRPASTIKREIDNHAGADGVYRAYAAHRAWAVSRPRPKDRKLLQDGPLRAFVVDGLRKRWSPQQICNALAKQYPEDQDMRVSTETIYQALYVQARGALKREVAAALRTGRTRRKPHRRSDQRTPRFVDDMLMISDRPAEAEDRAVPGHWEGDLLMGAGNRSAIVTLVERTTRYVMLGHLPGGHTAEEVRDVLIDLITILPAHLRGSLTWDQGTEMAAHKQFSVATGVPVYFCDPHSPWQRGSNENTNGLLRQYFPKGTDLSIHGPEDLEHVAQELNGRPRQTLGWDNPAERLRDLLTAN